ncbi:exported hypothetical protein [uncultured Mycobacterium sp.]|uniref:Uncharacterized protein n=1 Tax=uncultured Mycobacterium sp. TaxID=171292 RepID=A0A1Y5PB11_9MYCO|nr:exported hypothetical protein [uncultured Mycobacterium sp.]
MVSDPPGSAAAGAAVVALGTESEVWAAATGPPHNKNVRAINVVATTRLVRVTGLLPFLLHSMAAFVGNPVAFRL